jgi:hypothetical protein
MPVIAPTATELELREPPTIWERWWYPGVPTAIPLTDDERPVEPVIRTGDGPAPTGASSRRPDRLVTCRMIRSLVESMVSRHRRPMTWPTTFDLVIEP